MKKNLKQVSVVIPNYNGQELLEKNLPKVLEAMDNGKNRIKEIIIVDDASIDDSVDYLRKNFPQVKVIKHKKNRGFSASVNTGARTSKGKYLCLINNDVIPEVDFLEKVFRHFKSRDVFAVSLHEKGYGWAKGKFEDGYILHAPGSKQSKRVQETFWVNGGSGVFRRDVWMKLGGMDDELLSPFYWEDLDLSYRAAKRGYKLLWEPAALVYHKHETTIGRFPKKMVDRIRERNQLLFNWKNITSPALFKKHVAGITNRTLRHPGYLRIILIAFMRLPSAIKLRRKEKKETKVSDEAILAKFS